MRRTCKKLKNTIHVIETEIVKIEKFEKRSKTVSISDVLADDSDDILMKKIADQLALLNYEELKVLYVLYKIGRDNAFVAENIDEYTNAREYYDNEIGWKSKDTIIHELSGYLHFVEFVKIGLQKYAMTQ